MKTLKKDLLMIMAFFSMSAGVYYAGAKFHIPWFGGNDFEQYYQMTLYPFDNNALSPWAYRVMLPSIAHLIYKFGLFYEPNRTPYKDNYLSFDGIDYEPSVLSAIIFTNYIFLAFAAFFIYKSIKIMFDQASLRDGLTPVILPSLIFLSLSTTVHGYAGLTEGGTFFLVSFLIYLVLKNNLFLFSLMCFASILCRELIPLVLFVYILFSSVHERRLKFLIFAALAFIFYFIMKSYLQIPGNESQTDFPSLIANILTFSVTKEFFMQAILANNIPIFVVLLAISNGFKNLKPFLPFIAVIIILTFLGIAAGIGNNVGRILNIATPLLIIGLAEMVCKVKTSIRTKI